MNSVLYLEAIDELYQQQRESFVHSLQKIKKMNENFENVMKIYLKGILLASDKKSKKKISKTILNSKVKFLNSC
jgi:GTP1/Obg family GTP-binding protein